MGSIWAAGRFGGLRSPVRRPGAMGGGFTLIELLLVVGVVVLLVGITLPGLSRARKMGLQAREFTAARQVMTAWTAYATDFRGEVMPGYASRTMAGSGATALRVLDDAGTRLQGVEAQRYPWRLAPYMDYQLRGLYFDQRIFERYRGAADYRYRVSLSPSLGINAEFVGGKADPGLAFTPNAVRLYGKFYIQRIDEVTRPDRLIVFASARGPDFDGEGNVSGYYVVDAPNRLTRSWATTPYTDDSAPESFGFVDARHFGKAVTAMADGHADAYTARELDDMTRWANQATTADWLLKPVR
jgi:hypothetical protein